MLVTLDAQGFVGLVHYTKQVPEVYLIATLLLCLATAYIYMTYRNAIMFCVWETFVILPFLG